MSYYNQDKILIIDDNNSLAESIRTFIEHLSNNKFDVIIANSGNEGLDHIKTWKPELILLDLALPDIHGLKILSQIQDVIFQTRVLIISASGMITDRTIGLEGGADDYLSKPFNQKELYLRICNLLRRGKLVEDNKMFYRDIYLDNGNKTVTRNGRTFSLTPKEYQLLYYLMKRPGQVISRNELISTIWQDKECFPNLIDVYIDRLRTIIDKPYNSSYIKTAYGHGYYFDPNWIIKNQV